MRRVSVNFWSKSKEQEEDEAEYIPASDFLSPNAQDLLEYCRGHELGNMFAMGTMEE